MAKKFNSGIIVDDGSALQINATGNATNGIITMNSTLPGLLATQSLHTSAGGSNGTGNKIYATQAFIASQGSNLITNCQGTLGSLYNWSGMSSYDATDSYVGQASVKGTAVTGTAVTTEYITVNPDKCYALSIAVKATQYLTGNRFYVGLACYDSDFNIIGPSETMRVAGSDTTLIKPLAVGDMEMLLASAANWQTGTSSTTFQRRALFWGYRNSGGSKYADFTYTRLGFSDGWFGTQQVVQIVLTGAGSGYPSDGTYNLIFTGGGGSGAAGTFTISGGSVLWFKLTANGTGYTSAPTISFSNAGTPSVAATGTAIVTNNATASTVQYVVLTNSGTGFPGTTGTVNFNGGGASVQATGYACVMSGVVDHIVLTSQGTGYTSPPTIVISGNSGTTAVAYATLGTGIDLTNNKVFFKTPFPSTAQNPDNGGVWPIGNAVSNASISGTYKYITAANASASPTWTVFSGKIFGQDTSGTDSFNQFRPGTAYVKALFLVNFNSNLGSRGGVISTAITDAGSGYTSVPAVTFGAAPGGGLTTVGTALMKVVSVAVNAGGSGYAVGNYITVTGGTGRVARFTVTSVSSGAVTGLSTTDGGAYSVLPTLTGVATTCNPVGATGLTLDLTIGVESIVITTSGYEYLSNPSVTIAAPGAGVTATATATIGNSNQNFSNIWLTEVADRNVCQFQNVIPSETTLRATAVSSQTGRLFELRNSSLADLFTVTPSGAVTIYTTSGSGINLPLVVQRDSGTTTGNIGVGAYSCVGETFSTRATWLMHNCYADLNTAVSDQIKYRTTHASFGHTCLKLASGQFDFYGASASVTADAVVSKVLIATLTPAGNFSTATITLNGTAPQITLSSGTTTNYIQWANTGVQAPTTTTRSQGTKLLLYNTLSSTNIDYAVGIESNCMWFSVPGTTAQFKWYQGSGGGSVGQMMSLINNKLAVTGLATAAGLRSTGTSADSSGSGTEVHWDGSSGIIHAYDRTGSAYLPMVMAGSTLEMKIATTNAVEINASREIGLSAAPASGRRLYVNGEIRIDATLVNTSSTSKTFQRWMQIDVGGVVYYAALYQ